MDPKGIAGNIPISHLGINLYFHLNTSFLQFFLRCIYTARTGHLFEGQFATWLYYRNLDHPYLGLCLGLPRSSLQQAAMPWRAREENGHNDPGSTKNCHCSQCGQTHCSGHLSAPSVFCCANGSECRAGLGCRTRREAEDTILPSH